MEAEHALHTHLAEVVEASLGQEREEHNERADPRDDPRRCELQRRRLRLLVVRHSELPPSARGLHYYSCCCPAES